MSDKEIQANIKRINNLSRLAMKAKNKATVAFYADDIKEYDRLIRMLRYCHKKIHKVLDKKLTNDKIEEQSRNLPLLEHKQ